MQPRKYVFQQAPALYVLGVALRELTYQFVLLSFLKRR